MAALDTAGSVAKGNRISVSETNFNTLSNQIERIFGITKPRARFASYLFYSVPEWVSAYTEVPNGGKKRTIFETLKSIEKITTFDEITITAVMNFVRKLPKIRIVHNLLSNNKRKRTLTGLDNKAEQLIMDLEPFIFKFNFKKKLIAKEIIFLLLQPTTTTKNIVALATYLPSIQKLSKREGAPNIPEDAAEPVPTTEYLLHACVLATQLSFFETPNTDLLFQLNHQLKSEQADVKKILQFLKEAATTPGTLVANYLTNATECITTWGVHKAAIIMSSVLFLSFNTAETGCWTLFEVSEGQLKVKDGCCLSASNIALAYKTVGLSCAFFPKKVKKEKGEEGESEGIIFYADSEIPLRLPWNFASNKNDDLSTVCHHPYLCESSKIKSGNINHEFILHNKRLEVSLKHTKSQKELLAARRQPKTRIEKEKTFLSDLHENTIMKIDDLEDFRESSRLFNRLVEFNLHYYDSEDENCPTMLAELNEIAKNLEAASNGPCKLALKWKGEDPRSQILLAIEKQRLELEYPWLKAVKEKLENYCNKKWKTESVILKVSHTCCRPSHLEVHNQYFNSFTAFLQCTSQKINADTPLFKRKEILRDINKQSPVEYKQLIQEQVVEKKEKKDDSEVAEVKQEKKEKKTEKKREKKEIQKDANLIKITWT